MIAGVHGLAAAKVYIELHPTEDIVVLEGNSSCGGTWAADRLYPGLKSNNLFDSYEFPDFPMEPKLYGVQPGQHIPGTVLHQYFTDFARHFNILKRIRFNTKCDVLQPAEAGGWVLEVTSNKGLETLRSRKVIVATGLTSQPNLPQYRGTDQFAAPLFHAKDFCTMRDTLKTAKQVVIAGGAKSAFDVAYAYVEAGAHVDLVVRDAGNGPVWIAPAWVLGGKKRLEKLLNVRLLTQFSPCPFGGLDGLGWIRRFLHGTAVGRFMVDKFWGALGGEVLEVNGYARNDELKKLEPWNAAFWFGSNLSILNYDKDFFDMVRTGLVNVHVSDVDHLSVETVHLKNGTVLPADVMVCATGWKKEPSINLVGLGDTGIGLPQPLEERRELALEADEKILSMYPRLRDQPTLKISPKPDSEPMRLYRFIAPPSRAHSRDLAFAGMVSSTASVPAANAQALWISAYLDDKLDVFPASNEQLTQDVMLHTQWGKWRYPCGYGAMFPDLVFDTLPYIDMLLTDLGLEIHRKPSKWADLTEPYGPQDYIGLVQEWKRRHSKV